MPILEFDEEHLYPHFCSPPSWLFPNRTTEPDGTLWRCTEPLGETECGDLWVAKEYPEVRVGMQRTGGQWVNVNRLGFFERRRLQKRARTASNLERR